MCDINYLTQMIAKEMLARLEWMTLIPKIIIDMSFGNTPIELLKKRYEDANITVINEINAILPLRDHSVDLIFSNLFFSWCEDSKKLLSQWQRILRPNGLIIFSSFGLDTLRELKETYGNYFLPHLFDMHEIGDQLIEAKFAHPVLDVDYVKVKYQNPEKLFSELQNLKLLSKNSLPLPETILNITYEIIYSHAFGKEITNLSENNEIRIPLSHLRRRTYSKD